jgi:hypothetical protein
MIVRRGVQRLFSDLRLSMVPELALASGRRADLVALNGNGEIWIVEIKSSVEDFRSDRKWPDYRSTATGCSSPRMAASRPSFFRRTAG